MICFMWKLLLVMLVVVMIFVQYSSSFIYELNNNIPELCTNNKQSCNRHGK